MCQKQDKQANNNKSNTTNNKMTNSYSIKHVLKMLFKKHQKHQLNKSTSHSVESLESLDNLRNAQAEQHYFVEIEDNSANEKLADMAAEEHEDIYVPVRFARTEAGTFFWTTNLQPVSSTIIPAADEDLVQPAYCYSNWQHPYMQYQDRWAQA